MRFLISFCVILFTTTELQCIIELEPSKSLHSLFEEDDLTFSCNVVGCNKSLDFRWYKDNIEIHINETSYTITNLSRKDNGIYICSVRCGEKSNYTDSNSVNIELHYGPRDILLAHNMTDVLIEGKSSLHLTCKVECNPACSISWSRDGNRLSDYFNRSTIYFPTIWRNNSGFYQCSARGVGGQVDSNTVHVNVLYGPTDVVLAGNMTQILIEGKSSLHLTCQVECKPACSISWSKDDKQLSHYFNRSIISITTIWRNSSGFYQCSARGVGVQQIKSNKVHVNVAYGEVRLHDYTNWKPLVHKTSSLNMNCAVSCVPSCNIRWYRDEKHLRTFYNKTSLTYSRVTKTKAGVYYCKISGVFGDRKSNEVEVKIYYGPLSKPTLQNWKYHPKENESVYFNCNADCNPSCAYTWFKDGEEVRLNLQHKTVRRGDSGKYKCTASNRFGNKTTKLRMIVQYPPQKVEIRPDSATFYAKRGITPSQNISCNAECEPKCDFYWYRKYPPVSKYRYSYFRYGATLFPPRRSTLFRSSAFYCIAQNIVGSVQTRSIAVYIRDGPTDVRTTSSVAAWENNRMLLNCSATCIPVCTFKWIFKQKIVSYNSTLLLTRLTLKDSGYYNCYVQDDYGTEWKSTNLDVLYLPKKVEIKPIGNIVELKEGKYLHMTCEADCNPRCQYFKWCFDGNCSSLNYYYYTKGPVTSADSGKYHCSASNNKQLYVNSSNKVAVDVKYKPYIQQFIAKRMNTLSPNPLVLQFRVISNPPSNVTLLHYRKEIYFHWNFFGNSSFKKQTTKCSDTGYYYLKAENGLGPGISRIFVNVLCPPIIMRSDISSKNNKVGDRLSIRVTYQGNPRPTVNWYLNKWDLNITTPVQPGILRESKDSSLISIKSLSENDYGTYLICLKNEYGEVNKSFKVQGPPLPPSDINVECTSEATVYWKTGFSGGVHQTFIILYTTERNWNYYEEYLVSEEKENEGEQRKVLLSNLAVDSYYFKIISTNKFGNGSSEVFNCTLKANEDLSAGKMFAATEFGIGAAVLLIIIIIVLGLIVSLRISKHRKKETKQGHDNDIHETGSGLRENELYMCADSVELPLAQGVSNQGITNCSYALVMPSHKATNTTNAEYAAVVKGKSKAKEPNDVYATVVKRNTREFEIKQSVSVKQKPKIPKKPSVGKVNGKKKNVNKDGLLYAELDLKEPDCNERGLFVVHGLENKTDYADIDFALRADPLPDSDDDDEPE